MPPCKKVLTNKIKRTSCLTRMIKSSKNNFIDRPDALNGYWTKTENLKLNIFLDILIQKISKI